MVGKLKGLRDQSRGRRRDWEEGWISFLRYWDRGREGGMRWWRSRTRHEPVREGFDHGRGGGDVAGEEEEDDEAEIRQRHKVLAPVRAREWTRRGGLWLVHGKENTYFLLVGSSNGPQTRIGPVILFSFLSQFSLLSLLIKIT